MSSAAVAKNLTANIFQFGLRFILGVWFTRFLIHNLGTELYGLVPLAWGMSRYFSLITMVLNAPSGRFLIIARSQNNYEEENKIFNTVFYGICGICIILIIVSSIISYSAPFFLKVPTGHDLDSRLIFFAVSFAFASLTLSNPFSLSTFITNKLYLRFFNEALQNLVRVGVPVILIFFLGWQVGAISLGIIAGSITGMVLTLLFWKYLTPELKIQKKYFSISLLKQITGMGGWMLTNQVGSLLFLQSELFVVNILYGAEKTGRYGALLIFPTMLRSVAAMISSNLNPPIMDRYAKNDTDGVLRIVIRASRFLGIAVALPLGLLCIFSKPLLEIWLGQEFVDMAPVLVVMVAHLSINLAVLPMFAIQVMANKVKIPALITFVLGIINVILAIILGSSYLPFGIIGVPMAGAIVLTLKNAIFTPIYGSIILNIKKRRLFSSMLSGIFGFFICILLSLFAIRFITITNIVQLLLAWAGVSVVYFVFAWTLLLDKCEKKWILESIQNRLPAWI